MDTVAECYWLDAENSQCSAGDGYELKGSVGSVAVIEIAKATDDFVGKYMCEVVPSEPSDIKACEFQLKEEPRPTESTDIESNNNFDNHDYPSFVFSSL
ncbi:hypothetical protein BaRGS_00021565 [Batillaria attramentaria]|uniref:Ig-like domain-containing protein n=1 Tax=Batillaria attramentaria TaxID=370345 RepID=A0ABD0KJC5_9CAEN